MDLTEVEGLNDLVNAETEMQRKQALNQMEGSLSKLYNKWRDDIIKCLANVEAFIDFHEEENIEDDILDQGNHKNKPYCYL
jgi:tRNA U34 5-carboxymethylaminomethyl modifying GTPase MnmE/TrmE